MTLSTGLIRSAVEVEAKPGYHLVVYKVSARGLLWLQTLPPGNLFRPSLLQPWLDYKAFHVAAHGRREMQRKVSMKSGDSLHDFELEIRFVYRVVEPKTLVDNLDWDPLRRLRANAERIVMDRVRDLPWLAIKQRDATFQNVVYSSSSVQGGMKKVIDWIRTLGSEIGLEVLDVTVERYLSEEELAVELAVEKARVERESFVVQLEKQRQRTVLKARSSLDELTETLKGMVARAGQGVDTFPEMQRAIQDLGAIRAQLGALTEPESQLTQGQAMDAGPPLVPSRLLLSSGGSQGEGEVGRFVSELHAAVSRFEPELRNRLISTSMRLIAEVQDQEGDAEAIERHRQELLSFLELESEVLSLDRQQVSLLRRLTDIDGLRRMVEASP